MVNSITVPDEPTITVTCTGIIWNGAPSLDEWSAAFSHLWDAQEAIRWCLGDLLLYAEDTAPWGEMYTQVLEETPFSYSTLTQYKRVAKAIPYEERRPGIKWTHYQRLAALPTPEQRTAILDQIESGEIFSTDQTAEIVKEERAAGNVRADDPPPIQPEDILPPCPICEWPLSVHRGRCCNCQATVNEMAYRYRDLWRAACGFFDTGDVGTLDAVVSAYRNQEDR